MLVVFLFENYWRYNFIMCTHSYIFHDYVDPNSLVHRYPQLSNIIFSEWCIAFVHQEASRFSCKMLRWLTMILFSHMLLTPQLWDSSEELTNRHTSFFGRRASLSILSLVCLKFQSSCILYTDILNSLDKVSQASCMAGVSQRQPFTIR